MARCATCQNTYGSETLICPRDGHPVGEPVLDGRYRVLSRLGEGGMGAVYLAEHVVLQKKVAVKVLKGELARDPVIAQRFELEAVAASRIGHESIVDITDFGRTGEGALYFVMEHLAGQTLSDALRREGAMELRRALDILLQICRALEAAHAHGIVHRDIKPQNVMLLPREGGGDVVKLLDFGISKVNTGRSEPITEQGALLGTAEYMAPEQASGAAVDLRADIYSLGIVAYQLVTGSLPFRAASTINIIIEHLQNAPEPPSQRRPDRGLPPELERTIMRALSKRPEERQQSMKELSEELGRILAKLGTPATLPTEPGGPPLASVPDLADTVLSRRSPSAAPARRPWRAVAIGAVLAAALVAAAGGYVASARAPSPPAPSTATAPTPEPAPAAPPPPVKTEAPTPASPQTKPERPAEKPKATKRTVRKGDAYRKVEDLKPDPF